MNPSGSQGTQCVHQDFLCVVDKDTYQQSASMCVYRATQYGSRGLTFMINHGIRVLVAMTQLEDHMLQPCLTVSEYKIFELLKLIKRSLPMGVAPKAMAEIFGYRLKKIDKYIFCTSSCTNCRLLSLMQCILFLRMSQAPESKTG
jgi:hypothetical protein